MIVAGITGGIGSGKSHVARLFVELGAGLIDADVIGHQVLGLSGIRQRIAVEFGSGVIDDLGHVRRRELAKIVFGDSADSQFRLVRLESITHPEISIRIREQIESFRKQDVPVVILDAPVMFKSGWDQICDRILFVDASLAVRLERTRSRGWNSDELNRRESRQLPIDEKRARATDYIDNDQVDPHHLNQQVRTLWTRWTGRQLAEE